MSRGSLRLGLMAFLVILLLPGAVFGSPEDDHLFHGTYMRMIDEEGNVLLVSARSIEPGDQYLTADNRLFEVIAVEGEVARAKFVEQVELPTDRYYLSDFLEAAVGKRREPRGIGIYHTHNAESYVPTDGTHSINGKGGIHQVGKALAAALRERGIPVFHDESLHLPHNRGAYRRSRATVLRLIRKEPDAIFDVHRDAAPPDQYAVEIEEGVWVTGVQLVVGRANQNFAVNRQYAQSLKRIADMVYPGLVKGIYFGRGNYNQDLTPLNVLLEVGAHTNSRDAAERGIGYFADVVDFYFYGPRDDPRTASPFGGPRGGIRAALRTLVAIVAVFLLGGFAFVLINSGSWDEAKKRLRSYWQRLLGTKERR
ncbi:MAG: stage II sporulation protein P [Firmicutes bacterium]|jgi:stage II sporulation protein P|nr:stage II sporulation protein P [Bacillota bacterium]